MKINNVEITEEIMKERGSQLFSASDIEKTIIGKTLKGDYLPKARKYVCYMNPTGLAEGKNDLGTHSIGKWIINKEDNTIAVEWESYWDNWSGRMYNFEGKIVLFDILTNKLITSIHTIEDGKQELKLL